MKSNPLSIVDNCRELARLSLFEPIYPNANGIRIVSENRQSKLTVKLITVVEEFINEEIKLYEEATK